MNIIKGHKVRQVGNGTQAYRPGGVIYTSSTTASNVDTDETTLFTYTLPGNVMETNGDLIIMEGRGGLASNANIKTVKLYFGSLQVAGTSATWNGLEWFMNGWVTRTGATTQVSTAEFQLGSTGTQYNGTPAETLSGDIILKMTGQSNTGSGDVTGWIFNIWFYPYPI